MAIGDTIQAGLMRTDSSPIQIAGAAQARANQAFGNALTSVATGFLEGREKKARAEEMAGYLMNQGASESDAKAIARNPFLQKEFQRKQEADQRMEIAKLQASTSSSNVSRTLASKAKEMEVAEDLSKKKEAKLAEQEQKGLKFAQGLLDQTTDPEVLEDFNQAQPGLFALDGNQGARNRFLEYQKEEAPKVLGGELGSSDFGRFAIEQNLDPVMSANRFMELQKAEAENQPEPMTPMQEAQLEEIRLKNKGLQMDLDNPPTAPLSTGQETIDREFAKDLVEFNPADVEKGLTQLREASARLGGTAKDEDGKAIEPENLTGSMIGLMPNSFRDIFNPQASEVKEAVEEVVQRNLRLVLGAQFTEKEGQRLISRAYNPMLDETENKKRVDRLIQSIEKAMRQKQDQARYFNENSTLKGYQFAPISIKNIERDAFDVNLNNPSAPASQAILDERKRKNEMLRARQLENQYFDNPNVPNLGEMNSGN